MEFEIPEGWQPPENPDPDKDLDLVCSFKVKGNALCLTKLGDHPMPGYDEADEKKDNKPDYSSLAPKEDPGPMGGQGGSGMGMSSLGG